MTNLGLSTSMVEFLRQTLGWVTSCHLPPARASEVLTVDTKHVVPDPDPSGTTNLKPRALLRHFQPTFLSVFVKDSTGRSQLRVLGLSTV